MSSWPCYSETAASSPLWGEPGRGSYIHHGSQEARETREAVTHTSLWGHMPGDLRCPTKHILLGFQCIQMVQIWASMSFFCGSLGHILNLNYISDFNLSALSNSHWVVLGLKLPTCEFWGGEKIHKVYSTGVRTCDLSTVRPSFLVSKTYGGGERTHSACATHFTTYACHPKSPGMLV